VIVASGCGRAPAPEKIPQRPSAGSPVPAGANNKPIADEPVAGDLEAVHDGDRGPANQGQAKAAAKVAQDLPAGGPPLDRPLPHKIVYTAEVKLVVPELPTAEEQLKQLLKQNDGFVAQSELSGSAGSRRSGRWRVRVPIENFDAFVTELV